MGLCSMNWLRGRASMWWAWITGRPSSRRWPPGCRAQASTEGDPIRSEEAWRFNWWTVSIACPSSMGLFNLITSEQPSGNSPSPRCSACSDPYDGVAVLAGENHRAREVPAAGGWTHLYGDPGNSASSGGERLPDGALRPQWFGAPGPHHMVDRHLPRSATPQRQRPALRPGPRLPVGMDAFNGAILWEREIPDFTRVAVLRDGGNLALAADNRLYVATGAHCLEIDGGTGVQRRRFSVDAESQEWAYLAVTGGEQDLLIGSAAPKGAIRRKQASATIFGGAYGDRQRIVCSNQLFAMQRASGTRVWNYQPRGAISTRRSAWRPGACSSSKAMTRRRWKLPARVMGIEAIPRRVGEPSAGRVVGTTPTCSRRGVRTGSPRSGEREAALANPPPGRSRNPNPLRLLHCRSSGGREFTQCGLPNERGTDQPPTTILGSTTLRPASRSGLTASTLVGARNLTHGEQDLHPGHHGPDVDRGAAGLPTLHRQGALLLPAGGWGLWGPLGLGEPALFPCLAPHYLRSAERETEKKSWTCRGPDAGST